MNLSFSSPVVTAAMLRELHGQLTRLAAEPSPAPLVLTSDHRRIFLAGADLSEIVALDPASSVAYARLGRRAIGALYSYPAPTVAAVDGSCSGGGFDLVLACDAVVASPAAWFSHPGVQRGLVTGWGGTSSLPRRLGRSMARLALFEGCSLAAAQLAKTGIVHTVTESPVASAYHLARRLATLHRSRLLLWRSLRPRLGGAILSHLLKGGIID